MNNYSDVTENDLNTTHKNALMKTYVMEKKAFPEFVELLKSRGNLFGPTKQKNKYSFEEINDSSVLDFDYQRTIIGVKKFLTPPTYKTMVFNKEEIEDIFDGDGTNIVIGVHPCEIHSVKILDRLFMANIKDPYYAKKRESLILIGHSCLPDDNCLCHTTGTDMVEDGFDLFLTDLGDYYLVWVGSDKGLSITIAADGLLSEEISETNLRDYVSWQRKRATMFKEGMPAFKYMADIMNLNYDSDVWDQFGDKCLSCGTCSLVCPTCNCFNVTDTILMNAEEGYRERLLDSCTLPHYSVVAGDHDFRPNRISRLKLYYTHKLMDYIGRWGQPGCVGCGRCVTYCPVDINVVTVSNALYGEVCNNQEACE